MIFLISFVFVFVFGSIFVSVFVSVNEIDFYPFLPIFVFVFVNENYTAFKLTSNQINMNIEFYATLITVNLLTL